MRMRASRKRVLDGHKEGGDRVDGAVQSTASPITTQGNRCTVRNRDTASQSLATLLVIKDLAEPWVSNTFMASVSGAHRS